MVHRIYRIHWAPLILQLYSMPLRQKSDSHSGL
jgi:hypothetical protein